MAEEFGEMLRVRLKRRWNLFIRLFITIFQETLDKMRERIEVISNNSDMPDLPIAQRMEEIKLSDQL